MQSKLNYHHLHHFWVVAKQGGLTAAAAHLGVTVQTLSAQMRDLERALGVELFRPQGRRLVLTEAGAAAMQEADHIFALGEQLPARVRASVQSPPLHFRVGITDGLDKLIVRRSLEPVLGAPRLRILCHEGELPELLGEMAVHRLDAILCDRPPANDPALRLGCHLLSDNPILWHAPARWHAALLADFPGSLAQVPVLLPSRHAAVRDRIDAWLEREGIQPNLAGEFEDSALMATFAAGGMGVFPAPALAVDPTVPLTGLQSGGPCGDVREQVYVLHTQRKVLHPLVQTLVSTPQRL
jgi:LysR family transcriptional regulator, transcriptional activator of nhaA